MSQHVLIVDDDPLTREALALLLNTEGYVVAEAGDGAEALARLRSGGLPSLVLLDLLMPGMDGWRFLAERQRQPSLGAIPVLVLTAARGIDSPALRAMGAEDILQKPIAPEDVLTAIRRYC